MTVRELIERLQQMPPDAEVNYAERLNLRIGDGTAAAQCVYRYPIGTVETRDDGTVEVRK